MQRRQDSRPLPPTTMSLVFGDTSEPSSPSIAKWRLAALAATDTRSMTTTSNAKAATSTHVTESVSQTVGDIIQNAKTMIKARRLR